MGVVWDGYRPYVPPHSGLPNEMSRRDAKECYLHLIAARPERRAQLTDLLRANGLVVDSTDRGLGELERWFRSNVEPNRDDPNRLANLWYSVVNDIGLLLGDVAIERAPTLHWEFYVWGAKNISYQRHVIMGFTGVANPRYNIDFDRLVATLGHRIIAGSTVNDDEFPTWINTAVGNA